ncbi:DUF4232 domain-containing protein [Streptomyces sp. NRRL S-4]|uniref:DUF4232 domain-containing protein n=1 Tax=Streptomyces sp. NRRL S-4 TaxID=1519471 RepID=UPI0006B69555|nr:DUF4232 domain-containing protein [Streptomyces sp. NRRL S-4]KPC84212.1 hypothetical protein ADK82_05155 [Streptomyces sp. NRRL S-4]
MRTIRFSRTARTSVLGSAALIAALSLTACQSGSPSAADTSTATESQKPSGTSAAPAAATDEKAAEGSGASGSSSGKPDAKQPQDSGSNSGSNSGKDSGRDDSGKLPTCTDTNTKLTVTSVKRPVNHMLLTVTNTGSKSCYAYSYPFLRFGEAQSVPPAVEDSRPQSVVVLTPGQSAYAGILTSSADGSGEGGYSTQDLTVGFQGADGRPAGAMADVPLSTEVFVDSTLAVTYWQTDMDDALMY